MAVLDRAPIEARGKLVGGLDAEGLHRAAEEARRMAYAPYSGFSVGAALLTESGHVISAGNVENGSYGLTICAERAAVVRALAEGHRDFRAIAVAGNTQQVETLASCGACLQVLAEFDVAGRLEVVFPDEGRLRVELLQDLLPVQFRLTR